MPNNQANNYFGDITNFFLKAKREENIVIDEKKKAELRGSLMNEIARTKGLQVQDANIENPEIVSQSPVFNPTPTIAMAGMAPIVNIQENIAPVTPVVPVAPTPETTPIVQTSDFTSQQATRPGTEVAPKTENQISKPITQPIYEPVYVQPQQQVETGYTYEQNVPAQTVTPKTAEPIANPIAEPVVATNPAISATPIVAAIPVTEPTQVPQQPIQPIQPEQFSEVIGPAYMRSPQALQEEQQQAQSLPAYEEDYEDDEETFQDKFFDFWYQWQKRLVTIPLALFTLVAIVYAATNLDFTFKKDNIVTPKSNTTVQENISTDDEQTEPRIESTEITAIEKTNESDNATIDPVENYQTPTQESSRSLTKIPGTNSESTTSTTSQTNIATESVTTPTVPTIPPTTTQESPAETMTTQPTTQNNIQATQTNEPVEPTSISLPTTDTTSQTPEAEPEIQTYNQSLDTPLPTQITQPDKPLSTLDQQPATTSTPEINTQTTIQPEPEIDSAFSNITADEFANEIPQTHTQTILPTRDIEAEIEKRTDKAEKQEIITTVDEVITTNSNVFATDYAVQEPLSSQAESEAIFIREDSATYPIYYYRDSTLTSDPDFDKEILDRISNRQGPDSVSVYYLSETQVLVEVKEGDLSKWYLFTKVGDLWTIQKYEKGM